MGRHPSRRKPVVVVEDTSRRAVVPRGAAVGVLAAVGVVRTDPEIRAVLLPQLRAERTDALVVQEWGITAMGIRDGLYFSDTLIADVATVGDLVEAWEIKSAADSVARLPRQVPLYSSLFDRCTLVTASNHLKHARGVLPAWWGLTVALSDGDLVVERPAMANPGPYNISGLLWADEVYRALRQTGAPARRTDKAVMLGKFNALPRDVTAPLVRAALRARVDWRSPDGTHARREARRAIREREAEREAKRREDNARWLAAAVRPPVVG